jgi:hypothetical protein
MPVNNHSLDQFYTPPLLIHSITHQNQTPKNMFNSLVYNNTSMSFKSKDIIRQYGKYTDKLPNIRPQDVIH